MMRTLSLLLLIALLPRPAAAQSGRGLEISAGYSFVRDPKNDISLPSGWMVGAALPVSGWLSAVADVSGNRKTVSAFGSDLDFGVHAAMAGVRASARVGKLTEFAQVLAGVVRGQRHGLRIHEHEPRVGPATWIRRRLPAGVTARRPRRTGRPIHPQSAGRQQRRLRVSLRRRPRLPRPAIKTRLDADLRLEDSAVAAGRTLPRPGELVFVEDKTARPASRRDDNDAVTGGAGGADHVAQRVLDVRARQPDLAGEARHGSRFARQHVHQVFPKRHDRCRVAGWKYPGRSFFVSRRISTIFWRSDAESRAYFALFSPPDRICHIRA